MTPTTIGIVGGGITGLSAALTLTREQPDARVLLFEASESLGGKLHTIHRDGMQLEAGADSFIVRDDEFVDVCRSLGIAGDLVEPALFGGMVWDGRSLRPLPAGTVFGVPSSPRAVLGSSILSPRGRVRAMADLFLPGPLRGPDVSIGHFVRRRFGSEVLERMVDPILAGTRAGDPEELSLAAALPPIDEAARSSRSVMRGLLSPSAPPRFLTHRRGIGAITEAISSAVTAEIMPATSVERIEDSGDGLRIITGERTWDCDAAIVCIPAGPAAALLQSLAPEAARELTAIRHASVASIVFAFDAAVLPHPPGSGLLTPSSATATTLSAATWWSLKWPHTTPPDRFVVRAFVGRSGEHPALALPDAELAPRVLTDLRAVLPSLPDPVLTLVRRWPDGMPRYDVGHLDRVQRIESSLPGSVAVAGSDLRGSGIPDCYRQGATAARRISRALLHK
jgi:oxygen-dependent protoporphyrinogen oxidase